MSDFYKKFRQDIQDDLTQGKRQGLRKAEIGNLYLEKPYPKKIRLMNKEYDKILFESLSSLKDISGINAKYNERPGEHPDFVTIKHTNSVEQHGITSMFIDIKNSTRLFAKYESFAVANITTTIQRAAMHTCWYFDGYIQRFHGDGLMVYFGGKQKSTSESIQQALGAASYFSYFMENDLKNLFAEQGIEDIFTRIGIDTGYDEDVIWYLAGIGECSEITTCSLHTSLAYKVQQNAKNNGVMVGDKTKINSHLFGELFKIKKVNEKEERYIFSIPDENFYYAQWEFNWVEYIKNLMKVKNENSANLIIAPILNTEKNIDYLKSQVKDYRPSSFRNE